MFVPRDTELEWTMFKASTGACRDSQQNQLTGTVWPVTVVTKAKTQLWEEFGEATEKDQRPKGREAGEGQLPTRSGDIVGHWKEHFEKLPNTVNPFP